MNTIRLGCRAAESEISYENLVFYLSLDYPVSGNLNGYTFGYVYATGGTDIKIKKNRFYSNFFKNIILDPVVWEQNKSAIQNIIGGTSYFVRFDDPDYGITNYGNCSWWYGGTGQNYYILAPAYSNAKLENGHIVYPGSTQWFVLAQFAMQFPNSIPPSSNGNTLCAGIYGVQYQTQLFVNDGGPTGNTAGYCYFNGQINPLYLTPGSTAEKTTVSAIIDTLDFCTPSSYNSAPIVSLSQYVSGRMGFTLYNGFTFYEVYDGISNNSVNLISPEVKGNTYFLYTGMTTGITYSGGFTDAQIYFGRTSGFLKIQNLPMSNNMTLLSWMYLDPSMLGSTGINSGSNVKSIFFGTKKSIGYNRAWPVTAWGGSWSGDYRARTWVLDSAAQSGSGLYGLVIEPNKKTWTLVVSRLVQTGGGYNTFFGVIPITSTQISPTYISTSAGSTASSSMGILNGSYMDLNIGCVYSSSIYGIFDKFFDDSVGMVALYNKDLSSTEVSNFFAATKGRYIAKE